MFSFVSQSQPAKYSYSRLRGASFTALAVEVGRSVVVKWGHTVTRPVSGAGGCWPDGRYPQRLTLLHLRNACMCEKALVKRPFQFATSFTIQLPSDVTKLVQPARNCGYMFHKIIIINTSWGKSLNRHSRKRYTYGMTYVRHWLTLRSINGLNFKQLK